MYENGIMMTLQINLKSLQYIQQYEHVQGVSVRPRVVLRISSQP